MEIEHLAEHVDAIPTLASWVKNEWGYLLPGVTLEELVSEFEKRTTHKIPGTLVALEDGKAIGTASIVKYDMSTRRELSPWMASVYVVPEFRNRGIGSELVRAIVREAETLGLEKLYLFTPDRMDFYSRLGWKVFERTEYCGKEVTIMLCIVSGSGIS